MLLEFINSELLDHFTAKVIAEASTRPNIFKRTDDLVFIGFPSSDCARQITTVLALWNLANKFPIRFSAMKGFADTSQEHAN